MLAAWLQAWEANPQLSLLLIMLVKESLEGLAS